jgi:hypothetical protein
MLNDDVLFDVLRFFHLLDVLHMNTANWKLSKLFEKHATIRRAFSGQRVVKDIKLDGKGVQIRDGYEQVPSTFEEDELNPPNAPTVKKMREVHLGVKYKIKKL